MTTSITILSGEFPQNSIWTEITSNFLDSIHLWPMVNDILAWIKMLMIFGKSYFSFFYNISALIKSIQECFCIQKRHVFDRVGNTFLSEKHQCCYIMLFPLKDAVSVNINQKFLELVSQRNLLKCMHCWKQVVRLYKFESTVSVFCINCNWTIK